mgnify:CR=1 FL=1
MIDGATEQVTLDELIQLALDARLAEVHTSMPAVVESYDRAAGTVKVTLPVNKAVPDGSGNFVSEPYPQLADIPIDWPRCGKYSITFPLEKGDTGVLVFCMRNIGPWRTTGAQGDPGDVGMHTLDGAVFRPGLSPDSKPPSTADASNMVIGSTTDGKGRIELKPAGINLGAGASKGVVREGDKIGHGTIAFTFVGGTGGATLAIVYTPGDGSAVQTLPAGTGTLTINEKAVTASASIKAVD